MKCAIPNCNKDLPPIAEAHGDLYCSSKCARKAYGTEVDEKDYNFQHVQKAKPIPFVKSQKKIGGKMKYD
jgi:hypothetical protein